MLSSKKLLKYFEKQTRMFMVETKYDGERIQVHLDR